MYEVCLVPAADWVAASSPFCLGLIYFRPRLVHIFFCFWFLFPASPQGNILTDDLIRRIVNHLFRLRPRRRIRKTNSMRFKWCSPDRSAAPPISFANGNRRSWKPSCDANAVNDNLFSQKTSANGVSLLRRLIPFQLFLPFSLRQLNRRRRRKLQRKQKISALQSAIHFLVHYCRLKLRQPWIVVFLKSDLNIGKLLLRISVCRWMLKFITFCSLRFLWKYFCKLADEKVRRQKSFFECCHKQSRGVWAVKLFSDTIFIFRGVNFSSHFFAFRPFHY